MVAAGAFHGFRGASSWWAAGASGGLPTALMVVGGGEPFRASAARYGGAGGAVRAAGRLDWGLGVKRAVLGRSGNDRLSRVLRHSTIGAEEFNGRVRDGIGF